MPPLLNLSAVLQNTFDTLINSYIENKVGIAEHFIGTVLAGHLRDRLIGLNEDKLLLAGGTGNEDARADTGLIRSDTLYWLDRKHDNASENEFLTLIDHFVSYLNSTCYTGITGYEFHFTLYKKGAFYKRHLDQFRNDRSRQYSMVIYLNEDWQEPDGGQLLIHEADHAYTISPTSGKSIFFKSSELEHEVMITTRPRMSITGWLKQ